jgi:Tfp pilus assembly protein PilO
MNGNDMTLDDVAKQLTRGLSNLRADVRENASMLEQIRDELRAVHEAVGGLQEQLAEVPKRAEFDELRADVKVIKKVVGDQSRELTQLDSRVSAPVVSPNSF